MKKRAKYLKGQYTLYALVMTIIAVVAYLTAAYPILSSVLAETTPGMSPILAQILNFAPLLLFLTILWGSMYFVAPQHEQPGGYRT